MHILSNVIYVVQEIRFLQRFYDVSMHCILVPYLPQRGLVVGVDLYSGPCVALCFEQEAQSVELFRFL